MKSSEIILGLVGSFEQQIAQLDTVKGEYMQKVEALNSLSSAIEAEGKVQYDLGFDAGVKQVTEPGTDPKLYSEAELQAELQPLKDQMASMTSEIEALKAQLADSDSKVQEAVDAKVAEVIAEVEASTSDDLAVVAKYKKS